MNDLSRKINRTKEARRLGRWPEGTPPGWKNWQAGFIRLTKKTLVLLLCVAILLPSFIWLLLFKLPKPVKAEWYDETWAYRTSYSNNNTGSAVTNQKIKLDIDTATLITNSKIQSDCIENRHE